MGIFGILLILIALGLVSTVRSACGMGTDRVRRALQRDPAVCGGCGHPVVQLSPDRCGECGSPYIAGGVVTRRAAICMGPGMGSVSASLALLGVLAALVGATLVAEVVENLPGVAGGERSSHTFSVSFAPAMRGRSEGAEASGPQYTFRLAGGPVVMDRDGSTWHGGTVTFALEGADIRPAELSLTPDGRWTIRRSDDDRIEDAGEAFDPDTHIPRLFDVALRAPAPEEPTPTWPEANAERNDAVLIAASWLASGSRYRDALAHFGWQRAGLVQQSASWGSASGGPMAGVIPGVVWGVSALVIFLAVVVPSFVFVVRRRAAWLRDGEAAPG